MKAFFSVLTLSLLAATTSFAKATMICNNLHFSNLTVQLDSDNGRVALTVLKAANTQDKEHSPQKGDKAMLDLFPKEMETRWLVYHSTQSTSGRGYELSLSEEAAGQKDFKAALRVSGFGEDAPYYSYEMMCIRQ